MNSSDDRVLLVRYRSGVVAEASRTVHVLAVPPGGSADVVGALCGAVLTPGEIEAVAPGEGMPCAGCVLHRVMDEAVTEEPSHGTAEPISGGITYQQWGWPVTLHGKQVRLRMDHTVSALIIPTGLCAGVIPVLAQRRCIPPVLAHPYTPEHHIVLTGERFGLSLPWPKQLHQVTGVLLLPPTRTPRGSITWTSTPHPDSLHLCREIDLFTALRSTAGSLS